MSHDLNLRLSTLANAASTDAKKTGRQERLENRRNVGHTTKPCPGCGLKEERLYLARPKDEVCDECLELLWTAENDRDQREARKGQKNTEHLKLGIPNWGRDSCAWPRWYVGGHTTLSDSPMRKFEVAIARLIALLVKDRIVDEEKLWKGGTAVPKSISKSYSSAPTYGVVLPKGAAELIEQIDTYGQQAMEGLYKDGQEHGRSMLAQLAQGEITIGQFDSVEK